MELYLFSPSMPPWHGEEQREVLYKILFEFGIPRKLVRLIKMSLTGTYSRVRVSKNAPDRFPIRNGLKQGDALSPLLFNFALEQRFSNCGPRTTSGPRVLPLWSS